MIIDWYTIIFQIINFLVLVFLLRYFLYGPIIRAMDQREQKIVQREEDAAEKKKEAEQQSQAYRRKTEELQEREEEIREKAHIDAEKEKRGMLDQARREVEETRRSWEEAFEREKESFISELRRRIGRQACSIARRCLQDLADSRLESLTWDLFIRKITDLPPEERKSLQKALAAGDYKLVLHSAFEPAEDKLKQLKSSLQQEIIPDPETNLELAVKTDPSLVCGLELAVGGYRVAWSIDSYLEDVEEQVLKDLEHRGRGREAKSGAEYNRASAAHVDNGEEVSGDG